MRNCAHDRRGAGDCGGAPLGWRARAARRRIGRRPAEREPTPVARGSRAARAASAAVGVVGRPLRDHARRVAHLGLPVAHRGGHVGVADREYRVLAGDRRRCHSVLRGCGGSRRVDRPLARARACPRAVDRSDPGGVLGRGVGRRRDCPRHGAPRGHGRRLCRRADLGAPVGGGGRRARTTSGAPSVPRPFARALDPRARECRTAGRCLARVPAISIAADRRARDRALGGGRTNRTPRGHRLGRPRVGARVGARAAVVRRGRGHSVAERARFTRCLRRSRRRVGGYGIGARRGRGRAARGLGQRRGGHREVDAPGRLRAAGGRGRGRDGDLRTL